MESPVARTFRSAIAVCALVATALHAQTPQQTPAPAKGTGVVMGRVVDSSTNQPIAEAIVSLEPDPREQAETMRAAQQLRTGDFSSLAAMMPQNRTLTDADGVFVFRDVRKGTLTFNAEARGYLTSNGKTHVELDEGGRSLDVRIKLMRTGAISGSVVDDRGEPAVGATVHVYRSSPGSTLRSERGTSRTDDRGVFRIAQLEPGDYLVGVPQTEITTPTQQMEGMLQMASSMGADMRSFGDAFGMAGRSGPTGLRLGDLMLSSMSGLTLPPGKDGRISIYESVFYPGVQRLSQATAVQVASGQERNGVDLQLHLVPTSTVSGSVSGPSGPLRNAPVRIEPLVADVSDFGIGSEVASTTTKRDGTFVMLGVPDGEYVAVVEIQPPPDMPDELKTNPMFQAILGMSGSSKTPLFAKMPVTVHGADVRDLAILADEGVRVSGRIQLEGQAKLTPQTIQQTRITLVPAGSGNIRAFAQDARVNADGTFKTAAYPSGRYWAQIFVGDPSITPKSVMVDGHDLLRESMELAGKEWPDAMIVLTDKSTELAGVVRSDATTLPDNLIVLMVPQEYQTWYANGMPRALLQTAPVASNGAYRAQHVLSGAYLVAAIPADARPRFSDPKFIEALARVATHVTMAEGDRKTLDLKLVEIK